MSTPTRTEVDMELGHYTGSALATAASLLLQEGGEDDARPADHAEHRRAPRRLHRRSLPGLARAPRPRRARGARPTDDADLPHRHVAVSYLDRHRRLPRAAGRARQPGLRPRERQAGRELRRPYRRAGAGGDAVE